MSLTVTHGQTYETAGTGADTDVRVTNNTGLTYHVCDCCAHRVWFTTLDAVERHELANTPRPVPFGWDYV